MNLLFYHNAGKIYLSVLFILTNSFLIQAQNISNNLWSDLNLNYEIFNTIDLKYEIGNRSNDNGARKSYHDFIIKYSVNNRFKIAIGTRHSNLSFLDSTIFNDGLEEDFEDVADRFHFDVSGRLIKHGELKLKYRLRAQRKIRGFYSGVDNPTFKRVYLFKTTMFDIPPIILEGIMSIIFNHPKTHMNRIKNKYESNLP